MNQPPQTGKRIVSKGEYVRAQGTCAGLTLLATCCLIIGSICVILYGVVAFVVVLDYAYRVILLVLLSTMGLLCFKQGFVLTYQIQKIVPGVPLTRLNTADLPALDSLVRASSNPSRNRRSCCCRILAYETTTRLAVHPICCACAVCCLWLLAASGAAAVCP